MASVGHAFVQIPHPVHFLFGWILLMLKAAIKLVRAPTGQRYLHQKRKLKTAIMSINASSDSASLLPWPEKRVIKGSILAAAAWPRIRQVPVIRKSRTYLIRRAFPSIWGEAFSMSGCLWGFR